MTKLGRLCLVPGTCMQPGGSRSSKPLLQLLSASAEPWIRLGESSSVTSFYRCLAVNRLEKQHVPSSCVSAGSCDLRQAKRSSFLNCCSLVGVQINPCSHPRASVQGEGRLSTDTLPLANHQSRSCSKASCARAVTQLQHCTGADTHILRRQLNAGNKQRKKAPGTIWPTQILGTRHRNTLKHPGVLSWLWPGRCLTASFPALL